MMTAVPDPTLRGRDRASGADQRTGLSPARLVMLALTSPVFIVTMAVIIYFAASPFSIPETARHTVALGGCDAARSVGLAPAREGQPGYHAIHDADKNGVSCEARRAKSQRFVAANRGKKKVRMVGGAKFIRP